jgi:hypothetical protein
MDLLVALRLIWHTMADLLAQQSAEPSELPECAEPDWLEWLEEEA